MYFGGEIEHLVSFMTSLRVQWGCQRLGGSPRAVVAGLKWELSQWQRQPGTLGDGCSHPEDRDVGKRVEQKDGAGKNREVSVAGTGGVRWRVTRAALRVSLSGLGVKSPTSQNKNCVH